MLHRMESLSGGVVPQVYTLSGTASSRVGRAPTSQFKNNYFAELCSSFEAGTYSRLFGFVCHSTLGLRVMKRKKKAPRALTSNKNSSYFAVLE